MYLWSEISITLNTLKSLYVNKKDSVIPGVDVLSKIGIAQKNNIAVQMPSIPYM